MRFVKNSCCLPLIIVLVLAVASSADQRADFTVVVLPDTQFYSESYPETYLTQTEWIKDRIEADNVKFVIHVGDIVQNYNDAEEEWQLADRAHRVLDGLVAYSVLPGNHDLGMVGKKVTRDTTLYNKYFGPSRFEKYPWYGGHLGETNDNNYCFFEAAGMKFMVISLGFSPKDESLEWAGQVADAHKDRRVIVATHCYLRPEGRDVKCGGFQGLDGNSGEEIWNKLVRKHENIFLVVSGHVSAVAHQTSVNDAGRTVQEMLVDYQNLDNGGNGWLWTLRFTPRENKIHVRAYSPLLDEFQEAPDHTFTVEFDMSVPVETAVEDPRPERFAEQIEVFAEQDAESMPEKGVTVFTGSSSIRRWDLPTSFGDLDAINRGFGGSQISDVIHYADQVVLKYKPKTVVFFCGGNDLAAGKSPERVAGDFRAFADLLFAELPKTRLIVLAVKPSPKRWAIVDKVRATNDLIRAEAKKDGRSVFLDDAFDLLLDQDGNVREELFGDDRLHLNADGYRLWADILAPHLGLTPAEAK